MYRDDKIRAKQAELDWSNEVLAEEAHLNVNTITAIRRGQNVKIHTLEKVVTALGLTLAEVFEPKPAQVAA